jgi:AraC-like DNA-binding protein
LCETDTYREWSAPVELQESVACLWARRGAGRPVRVLPDGCTDIIWRAGTGAVVAGPDTGPAMALAGEDELIVGVRLRPGAGGVAFGLPLTELRDLRVPLRDLGLDARGELPAWLDPQTALARLVSLASRLVLTTAPDPAITAAAIRLGDARQRVDALAGELGLSERQLRRRFHAAVGYGPKTLQRVLRLQRFLALGEPELARAAVAAGYADQAHLTHDCRRLTGLTPSDLRRERSDQASRA